MESSRGGYTYGASQPQNQQYATGHGLNIQLTGSNYQNDYQNQYQSQNFYNQQQNIKYDYQQQQVYNQYSNYPQDYNMNYSYNQNAQNSPYHAQYQTHPNQLVIGNQSQLNYSPDRSNTARRNARKFVVTKANQQDSQQNTPKVENIKLPNPKKKEFFTSPELKEISDQIKSKSLFTSPEEQRKYEISQKLKISKDLATLLPDPKNKFKSSNIKVVRPNGTQLISTTGPKNKSTTLQVQRAEKHGELKLGKVDKKSYGVKIMSQMSIEKKQPENTQPEQKDEDEKVLITVEKAAKDIEIQEEIQRKNENEEILNDDIIYELNKLVNEDDDLPETTTDFSLVSAENPNQQQNLNNEDENQQENDNNKADFHEIDFEDDEINISDDEKPAEPVKAISISPPSPDAAERFKAYVPPDQDAILVDVIEGQEPISVYSQGQSYVLEKEESEKLPDYMFSTIAQKNIVIGEEEDFVISNDDSSSRYLQEEADDDDSDPYNDLMLIRQSQSQDLPSEVSECFKDDIINGIPKEMIKEMLKISPDDIVDGDEKVIKNFTLKVKSKPEKKEVEAKIRKESKSKEIKVTKKDEKSNKQITVQKPPKNDRIIEVPPGESSQPPKTQEIINQQQNISQQANPQLNQPALPQNMPMNQPIPQNVQMQNQNNFMMPNNQNPQRNQPITLTPPNMPMNIQQNPSQFTMQQNQNQFMMQNPQFVQMGNMSNYTAPNYIPNQNYNYNGQNPNFNQQFPPQNYNQNFNQPQNFVPQQNYPNQMQNFVPNQGNFMPNQFQNYQVQFNNYGQQYPQVSFVPPSQSSISPFQPPQQIPEEEINLDDYPEQEIQPESQEENNNENYILPEEEQPEPKQEEQQSVIKIEEQPSGKKDFTIEKSIPVKEVQIPTVKKITLANMNVQKVNTASNVVVERRTDLNLLVSDLSTPKTDIHPLVNKVDENGEKGITIGSNGITFATGETITSKTRSLTFNPDDLPEDHSNKNVKLSSFDFQPINSSQGLSIPSKPLSSFATVSIFTPQQKKQVDEPLFVPPAFSDLKTDEIFIPPQDSKKPKVTNVPVSQEPTFINKTEDKIFEEPQKAPEIVLPFQQFQLHPDQFNPANNKTIRTFPHIMNFGKQKLIGIDSTEDGGNDSDQNDNKTSRKISKPRQVSEEIKTESFAPKQNDTPIWDSLQVTPLGLSDSSSSARHESDSDIGQNNNINDGIMKRKPLLPDIDQPIALDKTPTVIPIKKNKLLMMWTTFLVAILVILCLVFIAMFII